MYWIDRFRHLVACAAMAVLCTGCAPMQAPPPLAPPPPTPPAPPPAPTVVYVPMPTPQDLALQQLLAFQASLSKTPAADWPKEASRLGDGTPSVADTMKLALLLAHTRTNGDLQRALGLLDKVLANPSDEAGAWHGLARMVSSLLGEQRRQEEQIEKLQQQLRDTQRDNQRRLDQLNEKLEALKSIERSLNNRAPALPQPPSSVPSPAQAPAQPAAKSAPRP